MALIDPREIEPLEDTLARSIITGETVATITPVDLVPDFNTGQIALELHARSTGGPWSWSPTLVGVFIDVLTNEPLVLPVLNVDQKLFVKSAGGVTVQWYILAK